MMTADEIELMKRLQDEANRKFDGHLTILKFTTNWRVSFATPDDAGEFGVRNFIEEMPVGATLAEAAQKALNSVQA